MSPTICIPYYRWSISSSIQYRITLRKFVIFFVSDAICHSFSPNIISTTSMFLHILNHWSDFGNCQKIHKNFIPPALPKFAHSLQSLKTSYFHYVKPLKPRWTCTHPSHNGNHSSLNLVNNAFPCTFPKYMYF